MMMLFLLRTLIVLILTKNATYDKTYLGHHVRIVHENYTFNLKKLSYAYALVYHRRDKGYPPLFLLKNVKGLPLHHFHDSENLNGKFKK